MWMMVSAFLTFPDLSAKMTTKIDAFKKSLSMEFDSLES